MEPSILASVSMAAIFGTLLWLGWRRRPNPTAERVAAGIYRDEWRRFRSLNRLSVALFLLMPLSWLLIDYQTFEKSKVVVWIVGWLVWQGLGSMPRVSFAVRGAGTISTASTLCHAGRAYIVGYTCMRVLKQC